MAPLKPRYTKGFRHGSLSRHLTQTSRKPQKRQQMTLIIQIYQVTEDQKRPQITQIIRIFSRRIGEQRLMGG